jgi:hypothetical protein
MVSESSSEPERESGGGSGRTDSRKVQARVALSLLEAMRDSDRPGEVLDDENVSETMPRRLGLSGVILSQILRYQEEVRRGTRVPESEVVDLMRLIIRRPDSDELFRHVGRSLTAADGAPGWRRIFPERLAYAMARRRVRRRLRVLFGSHLTRVAGSPFRIEGVSDLLLRGDPGGDACELVTALAQAVLETYGRESSVVVHSECRGRGGDRCLWEIRHAASPGDEGPPAEA